MARKPIENCIIAAQIELTSCCPLPDANSQEFVNWLLAVSCQFPIHKN